MIGSNLYFEVGDKVRIGGRLYSVEGYISFVNRQDNCRWIEYKLADSQSSAVKWLSIDVVNREYALYTQTLYSDEFEEMSMRSKGYKQVDSGEASVMEYKGSVDSRHGDNVRFTEFEDATEEKILAMETWVDETEYSKGYYLDADEIQKVPASGGSTKGTGGSGYSSNGYNRVNNYQVQNDIKRLIEKIPWSYVIPFSLILFFVLSSAMAGSHSLKDKIKKDTRFSYITSMTADINNKQRADVYRTNLSVEETAKIILGFAEGNVESVDESREDGTVAILTKKEYCLVYTSEDKETLVQLSSRKYTYYSRHNPYHSFGHTGGFYRSFYYAAGYGYDRRHYSGVNAYQNYTGGAASINNNNRYSQYSETIKQESAASRESSGGGTGAGK